MTFRLQTFGMLRLMDNSGGEIAFPEKGLITLGRLLASKNRKESRQGLARLLWPESDRGVALVNLRKLISRLRARQSEMGCALLGFSEGEVRLASENLTCDMELFEIPPGGETIPRLNVMAQALTDGFLSSIQPETLGLEVWIEKRDEYFYDRLREGFLNLLSTARSSYDFTILKNVALLLLERRPYDERVNAALKNIHITTGQAVLELGADRREASGDWPDQLAKGLEPRGPGSGHLATIMPPKIGSPDADLTMEEASPSVPRLVLLSPPAAGQAGTEPLVGALIEDIAIALCASKRVSVVAPYTAEQISLQSDKAGAFEKHAINYVLDTRLTEERGGHSIFAQLVHFGNDEIIWADRFDLRKQGLLSCRAEIAYVISRSVGDEIDAHTVARWNMERNPEAYRSFLLGTRYSKFINLPDVRRARKLFRDALQSNRRLAPAMSGLARTYFMEWLLTARGDDELLKLAEQRASQAIEIDDDSAIGYRELGVIKLYRRDFDGSLEALDEAETRSPHFANAIASYADTLVQASRPDVGLSKITRGMELNPLYPDDYLWTAAGASYSIGDYEQALAFIARMKDSSPADRLSAASWAMLGDQAKARQYVRKTLETHPDFELDRWLLMVPFKEEWQRKHYREGLVKAGY